MTAFSTCSWRAIWHLDDTCWRSKRRPAVRPLARITGCCGPRALRGRARCGPGHGATEAWSLGVSGCAGARRVLRATHPLESPVVAVAGIAQPEQFFQMLTEAGYEIARTGLRRPSSLSLSGYRADCRRRSGLVGRHRCDDGEGCCSSGGSRELTFACFAVPMGPRLMAGRGSRPRSGRARTRGSWRETRSNT
jgi:hypothetical protein